MMSFAISGGTVGLSASSALSSSFTLSSSDICIICRWLSVAASIVCVSYSVAPSRMCSYTSLAVDFSCRSNAAKHTHVVELEVSLWVTGHWLGATPSGLTNAHLHHRPPPYILQAGCPSCRPTNNVKALKASWWLQRPPKIFFDFLRVTDQWSFHARCQSDTQPAVSNQRKHLMDKWWKCKIKDTQQKEANNH